MWSFGGKERVLESSKFDSEHFEPIHSAIEKHLPSLMFSFINNYMQLENNPINVF